MKKILKYIFIPLTIAAFNTAAAQPPSKQTIAQFIADYSDSPSYSFVGISPEMLNMINGKGAKDNHNKIQSFRLLSTELNGRQLDSIARYLINEAGYISIMNVKDDGEHVEFFTDKKGRYVNTLVMLTKEKNEASLILVMGDIDMDNLSQLGLPNLKNINK